MKTGVIIISFIIFSSAYLFSQDKLNLKDFSNKTSYWRISYLAGTSASFESGNSSVPFGYNGGMEIGYYPSGSTAFFMNFNVNRLRPSQSYGLYKISHDVIELTMGPRKYLNSKKSFFIEGAIGTYMFNKTFAGQANIEESSYYYTNSESGFGLEIGCGNDFTLSKSVTLTLKTKLHDTFPDLKNYFYMGFYSAISFDNKNNSKKEKNTSPGKTFALTLLGGINNPDFFYNRKYSWGVNYGIEAAFITSPKIEYFISVINNKLERNIWYYSDENINNYIFELTTGPRFILNHNNVSPFIETGLGLYENYTTGAKYQSYSRSVLGMNFSTGLLINFTRSAGMVAKGKFNFLFSDKVFLTSYFTVDTGVRVNL